MLRPAFYRHILIFMGVSMWRYGNWIRCMAEIRLDPTDERTAKTIEVGSGKMSLIVKKDLEYLAELMEKRKDVILAYLFGSQAVSEKVQSQSSDIDIAVFFSPSPSLRELLRFRSDLTRLLKTDRVDLVSLNEASPLLKYEVILGGGRYTAEILSSRQDLR